MRRPLTFFAISAAAFVSLPAHAQQLLTNAKTIPTQVLELNIDEINQNTPIQLEWSASVSPLQAWDYEMSYDDVLSTETTTVVFLHLDRNSGSPEAADDLTVGQKYIVNIRPTQIIRKVLGDLEKLPGGSMVQDKGVRKIRLRVFPSNQTEPNPNTDLTDTWEFKYDTRPPPAPTIGGATIGENNVTLSWSKPASDDDVLSYQVVYCPSITETSTTQTSTTALPCDNPRVQTGIDKTQTDYKVEDGLQNDVEAAFAVRSVDPVGNIGPNSGVVRQTPRELSDFFELYQDRGGDEEGGFCFIATAATGSYAHPTVQVLRAFRDLVLKQTPLGTFGVWSYYRASPPLAAVIGDHPQLAGAVRFALIPIAIIALLLLLAPLFGAGVILWRVFRRGVLAASLMTLALVFAIPLNAHAYETARPKSSLKNFGIGMWFKGGPYLPALVDQTLPGDPSGGSSPSLTSFAAVFAEERDANGNVIQPADENPLYTIGVDLQLFRDFGTAGVGGSFGFMQFVGRAYFPNNGGATQDTTVFNIMPLALTAFYRFDYLADQTFIPFVPYLRGGLAYDIWWVTNGRGHVSRWRGDPSTTADDRTGKGGKFGFTGTLGMAIMLNVFEDSSARSLFESTSIRGTYFFVEYQVDKVQGFPAKGFDLSDSTWNMGLYVEL